MAWGLLFFSVVNVLISLWELVLWRHLPLVRAQYRAHLARGDGRSAASRIAAARRFMLSAASWRPRFWTRVWAYYSLYGQLSRTTKKKKKNSRFFHSLVQIPAIRTVAATAI